MAQNIILAGVGGQGILTIARAISLAALRRGLSIKQAEVHGMAQRGGAVESHLRIAEHELASDLIPRGRADLILACEPMEGLRHLSFLREDGALIAASNALVNIDNYPPIEELLDRICRLADHVVIDAVALAKASGSVRAANLVMLGGASCALELDPADIEEAIAQMFADKGSGLVESSRRAFRLGRAAAVAYRDGLRRGGTPAAVRRWLGAQDAEALLAGGASFGPAPAHESDDELTRAEAHAVERALQAVREQGREQLHEHEVYTLIELVGAIAPPRYLFVPRGASVDDTALRHFPGSQVVLKVVSSTIVHKSDVGGVRFVARDTETVNREIARLVDRYRADPVDGVLIVEFVPHARTGLGSELFVGIRATREFGPVIAAGLGGVDTEYLAERMRPGVAVAKAVVTEVTADTFLEQFRRTAAYEVLSGAARGHERVVSDGELLRCFRAFLAIARRFCAAEGGGPHLSELEVNPFAFRQQRMVPLDGRGRLGQPSVPAVPRPIELVERMFEPRRIAVIGVSAASTNMGRIILNNIQQNGFDPRRLVVIKPDIPEVDGVRCVASISALEEPADLLIVATPADQLPDVVAEAVSSRKVHSAILISGGVGEAEGSEALLSRTVAAIAEGRQRPDGGPVFLGPNSLGVQSCPGRYDTFFIPQTKLTETMRAVRRAPRRVALISQSGAFIITRLNNIEVLRPALTISIGNQIDLTITDLLAAVSRRADIDVIGIYAEGFRDLDGRRFLRAVAAAHQAGKIVVFYKAGRTESGRAAAAGHTAAVAGDYDVCQSAAADAGAIVVDTFKEFEQLLELSVALHGKRIGGRRVGAMSNAGFETVAMADTVRGARYHVRMAELDEDSRARLREVLRRRRLDRLVNARNPLDLTPMASEEAFEECARIMLDCDCVDALIVSVVPLTPALLTTPAELERPGSLAERLPRLARDTDKPLIFVVDCGPLYDRLAFLMRQADIPVFRSCDQAVRSLGRYLSHRAVLEPSATVTAPAAHAMALRR